MVTEDFYSISEKLLRKNPELWYGIVALVGILLFIQVYRFLRADESERQAMLRCCRGMVLFLILFALAAFGFVVVLTFLSGR